MKHLIPLLLFLSACGGSSSPPTGPLVINLINLHGTDQTEMLADFTEVQNQYATQIGVELILGTVAEMPDPVPGMVALDQRHDKFRALGKLAGKGLTYIWAGPLWSDGISYKTGEASGGCRNGYAVGFHKPRHPQNVGLMMHEIAHLLGASHTDDDSVMSGYLPAGTNTWFDEKSIKQILTCTGDKNGA